MKRLAWATAWFLLTASAAQAGQERLTGNWLIQLSVPGRVLSPWLLKIDAKTKATLEVVPKFGAECKLQDFKVQGELLSFAVVMDNFPAEVICKVPKGEFKKLYG